MEKQKTALVLGASYTEEPIIRNLKGMGYYVITSNNKPDLRGNKLADKYIYGDYSEQNAMLKIAEENQIDAIQAPATEEGVRTAAYIAEMLGLPGHDSYETTLILHNKDKFKKFAEDLGGINTPYAHSFDSEVDALIWAETVCEYPLIVKPVDLFAGNGVSRSNNLEQLKMNIHNAFSKSRVKRVLVEPFIDGQLNAISTFLVNKRVAIYVSNTEFCFTNPYRVETSFFPADGIENVANDLIAQIERIADALNLSDGIFHVQYILNHGKAIIIECMRRTLGNLYVHVSNMCTKPFDWYYWQTRAKCGLNCEAYPKGIVQSGFHAYKTVIPKKNGIFKALDIPESWNEYIFGQYQFLAPGDTVNNYLNATVCTLLLKFNTRDEMKKYIVDRHDDIKALVE